ncbi:MAG TPA: 3'-5' exonuclease [Salinivirgaceae bacterium]|nr:3'-5' exonuclease [Salinivirgaceae bacterium]
MNTSILSELNEAQREAVINFKGPSLIIAGAGSGKTRVLTHRIAFLLENTIAPHKIMALTFTNKAANEMRERIAHVVGTQKARSIWMGTFHSLFAKILRIEAERIGFTSDYTIYDTQDSQNLIKTIVKDLKLNPKSYKPNLIYGRISRAKNNLITSSIYASRKDFLDYDRINNVGEIYRIFQLYEQRCRIANAMDFDDLLLNMNILLRDHPDILAKYQNRFEYILVDEYQDTNFSQYRIIRLLSARHRNICVVGDDAQSIYAFRGARIENILNFKNDYPDLQVVKLEQNYRSTQTIVNAANSIIANNQKQLPKTVFSKNEAGEPLRVIKAQTDIDEALKIINLIENDLIKYQLSYNQITILYRNNSQSRLFEEVLRRKNIPYYIHGATAFYQRKEIKDALAYFKLVVNPDDDQSFLRVINYPTRGIGDTTINKIQEVAVQYSVSIWKIIHSNIFNTLGLQKKAIEQIQKFCSMIMEFKSAETDNDAYNLALKILRQSGMLDELESDKTNEGIGRMQNVEELLNGMLDFTTQYFSENQTIGRLSVYLEDVSLLTDADRDKSSDSVNLMTVHASKGLEFDDVFIVGLEEGLFPSALSLMGEDSIEEERRLFYVALTRAKKMVTLSWSQCRTVHGSFSSQIPSRFLDEIPEEFLSIEQTQSKPKIGLNGYSFNSNQAEKQFKFNQKPTPSIPSSSKNKIEYKGNFTTQTNLSVGQRVLHPVFGPGTVIALESHGTDSKARIRFNDGDRVLLLRFAKLQIL